MEVIKSFWLRLWGRIALAVSRTLDTFEQLMEEAVFRVGLARRVLMGKVPLRSERRWWNRAVEAPVLIDIYSWIDDRLICSILIWPSLESDPDNALLDQRARLEEVLGAFAEGAKEKMWSTHWAIDFGLRWDNDRETWTDADGHAYDGRRMFAYSRGIGHPGEYPDPPGGDPGGRSDT